MSHFTVRDKSRRLISQSKDDGIAGDVFFFFKMDAGGNLFFGAENSWRCLMVPDYADVTGLAVRITMVHLTQLWFQMWYMEMYNIIQNFWKISRVFHIRVFSCLKMYKETKNFKNHVLLLNNFCIKILI